MQNQGKKIYHSNLRLKRNSEKIFLLKLDYITGAIIQFMAIFTVWAFGSVYTYSLNWFSASDWAIRFMTASSYLLLTLLLVKKIQLKRIGLSQNFSKKLKVDLMRSFGVNLMFAIGAYIVLHSAISAWNARSSFDPMSLGFLYKENFVSWLPHSYDQEASFRGFWEYSGMFVYFIVVRNWLLGPFGNPEIISTKNNQIESSIPKRHRQFLLLLGINLGLVALVGIIQRLSGTNELLWIIKPHINTDPIQQFGPYPYRGNAAQIFNLTWPAFLAVVWFSFKTTYSKGSLIRQLSQNSTVILLPLLLIVIIAPVVTSSRAGAILMFIAVLAATPIILKNSGQINLRTLTVACVLIGIMVGAAWWLGGAQLRMRFEKFGLQDEARNQSRALAKEMLVDYFWLGSGPKSFANLFEFYAQTPKQTKNFYHLHDDYLEFLISFGVITFSVLILGLILVLTYYWWGPTGFKVPWEFHALILVGMATCLIHARIDFPFQVYSILFYFVSLCGVMTTIRRPS